MVVIKFVLHESDGVGIELALNASGGLNDIKIKEEFVKTNHRLLEVINTDLSILVKIKS